MQKKRIEDVDDDCDHGNDDDDGDHVDDDGDGDDDGSNTQAVKGELLGCGGQGLSRSPTSAQTEDIEIFSNCS